MFQYRGGSYHQLHFGTMESVPVSSSSVWSIVGTALAMSGLVWGVCQLLQEDHDDDDDNTTSNTYHRPKNDQIVRTTVEKEGIVAEEQEKVEQQLVEKADVSKTSRSIFIGTAISDEDEPTESTTEADEETPLLLEQGIPRIQQPTTTTTTSTITTTTNEGRQNLEEMLKASLKSPKQEDMQALFDEIDKNGDGRLSRKEVEDAICDRKQQFNLKPAVVLRAFQKADSNQDGFIRREEFFILLKMITYYNNLYKVFSLMDTNKDRHLSKEEVVDAADILGIENPETVFEEMDEHLLGYIVFDDFCLWMAEHQVAST